MELKHWIDVNDLISKQVRNHIIGCALEKIHNLPDDLRKFATKVLAAKIHIDGFRNFIRAPHPLQARYADYAFRKDPAVCDVIVGMWAASNDPVFKNYEDKIHNSGLHVSSPWEWQDGIKGFYPPGYSQYLSIITETLSEGESSVENGLNLLAELWFSGGIVKPKESFEEENHITDSEGISVDEKYLTMTIAGLKSELGRVRSEVDQIQQPLETTITSLKSALDEQVIDKFDEVFLELSSQKIVWENAILREVSFFEFLGRRLLEEVMERSDIPWYEQKERIRSLEAIPDDYDLAETLLADIEEYDKNRIEAIGIVKHKQSDLAELLQAISTWEEIEDNSEGQYWIDDESLSKKTIKDIQSNIDQLSQYAEDISRKLKVYRNRAVSNILLRVKEISDLSSDPDSIKVDGQQLSSIKEDYLAKIQDQELKTLALELEGVHTDLLTTVKSEAAEIAAKNLIENEWNSEVFLDLFQELSKEKRSGELLLLHLSASKLGYLSEDSLTYSSQIVDILFTGLDYFAGVRDAPLCFIGSTLPAFLAGWKPKEKEKLVEICILAMISYFMSKCRLPDGFLWTIADTWPMQDKMPSWGKVWDSFLLNAPVAIYTDEGEQKARSVLDQTKAALEQAFHKDGGRYTRLSSLSSNRHRVVIINYFMPDLETIKSKLLNFDHNMNLLAPIEVKGTLNEINKYLKILVSEDLSENDLEKKYNASIFEENIDDQDPFHKRVTFQNIQNCAETLIDFGYKLRDYWLVVESRRDGIKYQDLTEELNLLGTQNPLFAGITEHAFHLTDSGLPGWNEAVADSVTIDGLLRKLLEERAYAMRMPNLVAYLVNNEFSWEKVYEKVLWDIAHPLTPEEAADYLVQQDAVNQASLLVDFLKLESHDLLVEQHHVIQIRELKRELQTLDPKSDVLSPELNEEIERDIELGRWGRLKVTLEAGIDILRAQQREEQDRLNQGISKLISDINSMDMQLFEKVDDIPQDALITVQKALSQARTSLMSRDPELIPVVEDYLDHLRFRLERSSWPLEEVREYSADFIQRLTFHELEETEKYSIEELTRAFEDGRLEELGIMQYQLGGSRAQTRMEVLDYWLRLKNEKGVFSGEYGSHVPDFVRQLNSIFGRMIQMKRVISKGDRPLSSDTPLVYEYWQLMYPKTVELEKYCVLMTLPGGSLTGQDIRLFNEFLADKAFEEYHFVIIFTPGCPTSLTEKIKGSMGGDRLILIDDKLMKNLVLAELQGKKPVDLLRPMMMQSMQDSATIFIVNQSTNEHTGIFVGRGARIRTLASSTENYAVYGGRRIGKSSLLNAVKIQLENNKSTTKTKVVYRSLEGELDYDNQHISKMLAKDIGIYEAMGENGDFKDALSHYLQKNPDEKLVIMIDEIDRYIQENKDRHLMIEALRACSDQYGSRLRVIVSGFMQLYDCLKGKGPYSENSDPWSRMFENMKPLGNLQVHEAEKIVKEGFVSILGWQFENRTIPQLIVERTGGHPAFVQCFCAKLLDYVRSRGRHLIKVADIDAINNEITPGTSYMAYVQATLGANLDDTAQFLLLSMAQMSSESSGFTLSRIKEIASLSPIEIDDNTLERLLEKMTVTSVVEKRSVGVYDFTVKDYPKILVQLSSGDVLKDLERRMIGNTDSEENGR